MRLSRGYSALLPLLLGFISLHGQSKCEVVYPIPATTASVSGEVSGAASLFKGLLGRVPPLDAKAKAKGTYAQTEVLSKYPHADLVALRQQELALTCQILRQDSKLSSERKIAIIQRVGEGIDIANGKQSPKKASRLNPPPIRSEGAQGTATSPSVLPGIQSKSLAAVPSPPGITNSPGSQSGSVSVQGNNNSCNGIGQICSPTYAAPRAAPAAYIYTGEVEQRSMPVIAGQPLVKLSPYSKFSITIDDDFPDPYFRVKFDGPYRFVSLYAARTRGDYEITRDVEFGTRDEQSNVLLIHVERAMSRNERLHLTMESGSSEPIKALSVESFSR